MKDCGTCKGFPGCDSGCKPAGNLEQAVIDTARNYVAIVKTIDIDSPNEVIAITQRRRGELVKAVERLEACEDG